MKTALDDLFSTGKGILALALLAGATVLASLGRMPIEQWQNFAEWIFGSYAGAVAITKAATAIANRPGAQTATAGGSMIVVQPDALSQTPAAKQEATKALVDQALGQKGFVALGLLVAIAAAGALMLGGCGASARTVALRGAVA